MKAATAITLLVLAVVCPRSAQAADDGGEARPRRAPQRRCASPRCPPATSASAPRRQPALPARDDRGPTLPARAAHGQFAFIGATHSRHGCPRSDGHRGVGVGAVTPASPGSTTFEGRAASWPTP